jgi:hypothetical protein
MLSLKIAADGANPLRSRYGLEASKLEKERCNWAVLEFGRIGVLLIIPKKS